MLIGRRHVCGIFLITGSGCEAGTREMEHSPADKELCVKQDLKLVSLKKKNPERMSSVLYFSVLEEVSVKKQKNYPQMEPV